MVALLLLLLQRAHFLKQQYFTKLYTSFCKIYTNIDDYYEILHEPLTGGLSGAGGIFRGGVGGGVNPFPKGSWGRRGWRDDGQR